MPNIREPGDNSGDVARVANAAGGRQDFIRGGGTVATFDSNEKLVGRAIPAGTTKYQVPIGGSQTVEFILGTASGGANITAAKAYPTGADGVTQKAGSTAVDFTAPFVDGTPQIKKLTDPMAQFAILEVTASAEVGEVSDGEYSTF